MSSLVSQQSLDVLSWDEPALEKDALFDIDTPGRRRRAHEADCDITNSSELRWAQFCEWLCCICVVTFDLERGQSIEEIFPPTTSLDPSDVRAVCYLAFPDSNSGCMGDHEFTFRVRGHSEISSPFLKARPQKYYFGTVHFRQVADRSNRRGFFQKSVVLLSQEPLVGLYSQMAGVLARAYFDRGVDALEAGCRDICAWPAPARGVPLQLPLLDYVYDVRIPLPGEHYTRPTAALQAEASLCASVSSVNMYTTLKAVRAQLQALWELVLTAEPLVVSSPTPVVCSRAVMVLTSLIAPLQYHGDYRPYFTIHCEDGKVFARRDRDPPQAMLGVTNPVFDKLLGHWPHTLRIGIVAPRRRAGAGPADSPPTPGLLKLGKQGLHTTYRAQLDEDRSYMSSSLKVPHGANVADELAKQDNLLRDKFAELTRAFTIPLEQYVARIMPLKKEISPFKPVPRMAEFNARAFLLSLPDCLPTLNRIRNGNWPALYGRFLKSVNFRGWLRQREREINENLLKLYLQSVADADLQAWAHTAGELRIVDFMVTVRAAMDDARRSPVVSGELLERLQDKLLAVVRLLPEDLRASLAIKQ
eukprot:m.124597 g.124597  ORF g.124597 m.124597 type:complete len:587 (+) comp19749_c0_seq4:35-1795(+)